MISSRWQMTTSLLFPNKFWTECFKWRLVEDSRVTNKGLVSEVPVNFPENG
jgi:hypothetical protein